MTVRARIWSTSVAPNKYGLKRTWHYEVYNTQGDVVLYDNTGAWPPIFRAALIRVEALRHMEIAGHRLERYYEEWRGE